MPELAAPSTILCADWAKDECKRAVYIADVRTRRISRAGPARWTFSSVLDQARLRKDSGPVLVAFDAPIGAPASYVRAAAAEWDVEPVFIEVLRAAAFTPAYFESTRSAEEWSIRRPFFAVPPGNGGLRSYRDAADKQGVSLMRKIDSLTGAKTLFAKAGIRGSVGSATCDVWTALARELASARDFRVWPFEGDLAALIAREEIIIGEMYPRAAYATALTIGDSGTRPRLALAKTDDAVRAQAVEKLTVSGWVAAHDVALRDLDYASENEDDFDACMTAAALLRCVLEGVPLHGIMDPAALSEGGILGTGAVNLALAERKFDVPRESAGARPRQPAPRTLDGPERATTYPCPLQPCSKIFIESRGGWDGHVASSRLHPHWLADVHDPEERKRRFRAEHSWWFNRSNQR